MVSLVREQAERHPGYGYRRITVIIRRENLLVNPKRVHRIWKAEGLQLTRRPARKRRYGPKGTVIHKSQYPNHVWTYDFLADRTERGHMLRFLTVLDEYTRESLAIHVDRSIKSASVLHILEWLFLLRGAPDHIRSDNGPEFIAHAVQNWLRDRRCQTIYITPGSPWENPFIESFNGKFREECLNRYIFENVQESRQITEAWRIEYNQYRPHSSLGYLTPQEFALQSANVSSVKQAILSL